MEKARITEVAPRDGLQNERGVIPTADKVRLVELLCAARSDEIEVTSFVPASWIPQFADAAAVIEAVAAFKPAGMIFSVLAPNERGLQNALDANGCAGTRVIDKVAVFTAASETFSRKNTNASIRDSVERFVPVVAQARSAGLLLRGYVSCVVACPFEGLIAPSQVAHVVKMLVDLGIEEIDLGETIGVARPAQIPPLLDAMFAVVPAARLTLHLHDTSGHAAACARQAVKMGIRSFDAAAGGLGGCPYASTPERRAPGNISTQALLYALEQEGLQTTVDPAALQTATNFATGLMNNPA